MGQREQERFNAEARRTRRNAEKSEYQRRALLPPYGARAAANPIPTLAFRLKEGELLFSAFSAPPR
jgi:hypothetical protein